MKGIFAIIGFQSVAHTTVTPTTLSHTALDLVLCVCVHTGMCVCGVCMHVCIQYANK